MLEIKERIGYLSASLVIGCDRAETADLLIAVGVRTLDVLVHANLVSYALVAAHEMTTARHEHCVANYVISKWTLELAGYTLGRRELTVTRGARLLLTLLKLALFFFGEKRRLVFFDHLTRFQVDFVDHVTLNDLKNRY